MSELQHAEAGYGAGFIRVEGAEEGVALEDAGEEGFVYGGPCVWVFGMDVEGGEVGCFRFGLVF